ncbi:MAG: response regulator transcription factor [Proteobacteria bacterium]|nr:response regulator transcription factor [Pseudomonadota bacterium]
MPEPQRLLLIDPDPGFRRILREQLEQDGAWRVDEAASLEAVALPGAPPDMVVTTVVGRPARAALARWRQAAATPPLVALVGAGGSDVAGASLTIRKPVRLSALLTAITALGRCPGESVPVAPRDNGTAAARELGPYRFDPAAKRLTERTGARTIRLTEKEAAMLDLLWHAAGRVVPRDALLAQIWGYQSGISTHTLETHVYRLRRKIERDPARAELLITELGGYRLAR